MQEMEFKLTASGRLIHDVPQQIWCGENPDYQYGLFGGQEMLAVRKTDNPNTFERPPAQSRFFRGGSSGLR